ncbi:MAG: GatB/YqeY domain-containing protein [Gammaproteobacteria bacterium]|nr:GatB/YqeY domain-containing protein [Gammaproteobacteria bacterium]
MSALKDQLNTDIKAALKGGDKIRVTTLRGIMAAFKQVEVDSRITLDDAATIGILTKLASQRRDSITQYDAAQRADLADKERAELTIIESYLPAPLSAEEVEHLITAAIARLGATQMKDMGKVMAELRPLLVGRADLAAVSTTVKTRLTGQLEREKK